MSTVINFKEPFKIKNSKDTVSHIDLNKVNDGIFFLSKKAYLIDGTGLKDVRFTSEILYNEELDTLECVNQIEELKETIRFTIDRDDIELILKEVIEEDETIFNNGNINSKIIDAMNTLKEKAENVEMFLLFENEDIECKYGRIDDNIVFNRMHIDDKNKLIIGEAVKKDNAFEPKEIHLYLNNNNRIDIDLRDSSDIKTSSSTTRIKYIKIEGKIKWKYNTEKDLSSTSKRFFIPTGTRLPSLDKDNRPVTVAGISNLLYRNMASTLDEIVKKNKSLLAIRLNIVSYMLS